ncbi:sortase [Paenibacillus arenilitoris]|uniref:Sortase n=1 Tax=Paenibacillus arenilitoris TaxID=2772299 RepID=A0A927CRJ7_9BACL|nr:sortase [Paenibacillus arenilitoris]MBD2871538.1 sortase [Paenibacillus arenilitoris]
MRRFLSIALVLAGVLILLYPKASEWYENRQQQKLLAEWEQSSFDEEARQQAQRQYEQLTQLFREETGTESASPALAEDAEISDAPSAEPSLAPSATPQATPAERKPSPIATITIDKIKLKLPVLEGATQKNMKSAAAHLKETTALGQVGNAAIAGHRMRSKGRLFNRLGELEAGDKIVIDTKGETYTYTVYKVSIVEPTDVSVLNYNNKDKLLTLITCDPIVDPTHRLIIHAKL